MLWADLVGHPCLPYIGEVDLGIGGLGYATEIGAGASAIVYRARQLDLDREVAVKVLSVTDEAFVRRFRREAKTLGKLSQNPGIVTVYDTGVTAAGQPYLILELCTSSVLDHLNTVGVFEPLVACQAGAQVADAVADAHENGVVHRDLKPGNVLVSQTGRYMVTDFGISTVTGATMGQTNSVGFTAGYVAPETLTGEPVGAPSDVYALGATLFHMVAGHAPFAATDQNSNLLALAQRVVNDPVPDLRPTGVPDNVCEAIEASMAKRPEDRPTALELRDRLRALAGRPAPAMNGAHSQPVNETVTIASPGAGRIPPTPEDLGTETTATPVASADATVGMAAGLANGLAPNDRSSPGQDVTNAIGFDGPNVAAQPASTQGTRAFDPTPASPSAERNILSDRAAPAIPLAPTAEERRYLYTEDDRRQLGPLILGAIVGLLVLLAVGAFLITRGGDDSANGDEGSLTEAVDGPTSTLSASGNEATNRDGSGNRGNLATTSTTEDSTTTQPLVRVSVPNVVGTSAAEATAELTALGLVVNQVDEESDIVAIGDVVRQEPSGASTAFEGDVVSIYVSTAGEIETVDVPRLVGLTLTEARAALTAAGLTSTLTRQNSETVPKDDVISSTPEIGTTVNVDSAVALVISDGPAPPQCSEVTGLTEAAARARMEAGGLTVSVIAEASASVTSGLVISCTQTATTAALKVSSGPDPCSGLVGMTRTAARASLEAAGLTVTSTATISATVTENQVMTCTATASTATITYATAVPPCPAVAGQTVAQARAALTAAGFANIDRRDAASATVPAGEVISCAVTGTTATLTVSSGPADVGVPDVAGMSTAAATTVLTDAGLVRGPLQEVDSDRPAGEVIRTSPAVGALVAPGTSITLVVSSGPPPMVTVPNIIGSTQAAATATLTGIGLTVTVATEEVPPGSASIGTVLSVAPAVGTSVPDRSAVTIRVAVAGPDTP